MQHIIYRMKCMLRAKSLLFWSLAFPIVLGILFYFMFGGIHELEQFDEVAVGIINAEPDSEFLEVIKTVEADDVNMFTVVEYSDRESAMQALEDEEIHGIIDMADEYQLIVKKSDIYTSFIKVFLDQYQQNTALIVDTAKNHPERVPELVASMTEEQGGVSVEPITLKGVDKDPYAQYFYALIAMTCLIGTMVGMNNGKSIEANLSPAAARRNVSATPKLLQVLQDFFATYVLYCGIVTIVIGVCIFVFQQDFGKNVFLVLLGGFVGSFTAIAIGMVIAVFVKGSMRTKEACCTLVFMGSSFLAGLQWGEITYLIEQKCPVINRINPATLIVNGYKSMAVFGDYTQYAHNMLTLFAIGVICIIVCIGRLRRERYAGF